MPLPDCQSSSGKGICHKIPGPTPTAIPTSILHPGNPPQPFRLPTSVYLRSPAWRSRTVVEVPLGPCLASSPCPGALWGLEWPGLHANIRITPFRSHRRVVADFAFTVRGCRTQSRAANKVPRRAKCRRCLGTLIAEPAERPERAAPGRRRTWGKPNGRPGCNLP